MLLLGGRRREKGHKKVGKAVFVDRQKFFMNLLTLSAGFFVIRGLETDGDHANCIQGEGNFLGEFSVLFPRNVTSLAIFLIVGLLQKIEAFFQKRTGICTKAPKIMLPSENLRCASSH